MEASISAITGDSSERAEIQAQAASSNRAQVLVVARQVIDRLRADKASARRVPP